MYKSLIESDSLLALTVAFASVLFVVGVIARSRYELESLDDRCLQDMGMSRCTADFEAAKPFWMA
jgi:hypothetical protein